MVSEKNHEIKIIKRTFEWTLINQEELRDTLEILIKENRCLTSEERSPFFLQFSRATLGLGRDSEFRAKIEEKTGREKLGSIEYMGRYLAIQEKNTVEFSRLNSITKQKYIVEVPIGNLWKCLLLGLFNVFPLSLDRASAMSKEHESGSGADTHGFTP